MPRKKLNETLEETRKRKNENSKRSWAKVSKLPGVKERKNKRQRESYAKDLVKNRKKNREGMARRTESSKYDLFVLLSKRDSNSIVPCCACKGCNEKTFGFLSIDHIKGITGKWKRNQRGKKLAYQILNTYKKTGVLPEDIRVLCHNCNLWCGHDDNKKEHGEGDILKYCPHNKKKSRKS